MVMGLKSVPVPQVFNTLCHPLASGTQWKNIWQSVGCWMCGTPSSQANGMTPVGAAVEVPLNVSTKRQLRLKVSPIEVFQ